MGIEWQEMENKTLEPIDPLIEQALQGWRGKVFDQLEGLREADMSSALEEVDLSIEQRDHVFPPAQYGYCAYCLGWNKFDDNEPHFCVSCAKFEDIEETKMIIELGSGE